MTKTTLTAEVKVRLTADEKALLKRQSDDTGVGMSDIVRSALFYEKKLVFLVEGRKIASELFRIRTDLDALRQENIIPASEIGRLEAAMNDVGTQLSALTEQLSDVHTNNVEADNDD